jgi:hypothetical protein
LGPGWPPCSLARRLPRVQRIAATLALMA